jgi:hypothetical protein
MEQQTQASGFFKLSVVLLFMAGIHHRISYSPADSDLWGHVGFGTDMIAKAKIVLGHPYS